MQDDGLQRVRKGITFKSSGEAGALQLEVLQPGWPNVVRIDPCDAVVFERKRSHRRRQPRQARHLGDRSVVQIQLLEATWPGDLAELSDDVVAEYQHRHIGYTKKQCGNDSKVNRESGIQNGSA